MKIRIFILLSLLSATIQGKTQELKAAASIGVALVETNFLKKNCLYNEVLLGYEQKLKNNITVSGSLGLASLSFSYYDKQINSVYNERQFISIPILIKNKFKINNTEKINFFGSLGGAINICFKDKKEIQSYQASSKSIINNTGYNICLLAEVGAQFLLTTKTALNISLNPQFDIITHYSNELNKIKLVKNLLCFSYNLKLK